MSSDRTVSLARRQPPEYPSNAYNTRREGAGLSIRIKSGVTNRVVVLSIPLGRAPHTARLQVNESPGVHNARGYRSARDGRHNGHEPTEAIEPARKFLLPGDPSRQKSLSLFADAPRNAASRRPALLLASGTRDAPLPRAARVYAALAMNSTRRERDAGIFVRISIVWTISTPSPADTSSIVEVKKAPG